ncbi:MAG TPA: reverse transcriptase domain-containing protein [Nitrococcus sp.]|nr:reverse transcriptase domain-containing protein [Nitrococcus sp.]
MPSLHKAAIRRGNRTEFDSDHGLAARSTENLGLFEVPDRIFSLDPAVATVIAQIACHENALPQGSPCSPVISNFIGNILDLRLLALARDAHCTYTRYADDLTFSTNEKLFPGEIAINTHGSEWSAGDKLLSLTPFSDHLQVENPASFCSSVSRESE